MGATGPQGDRDASDAGRSTNPAGALELVVDPDPAAAGAAVRAHLDAGRRAAGFVGDPDDPELAEFTTDVLRPER